MRDTLVSALVYSRVVSIIEEAKSVRQLEHNGLVGRFREILLSRLLTEVLPPTCRVVHGTTVDADNNRYRSNLEDDILIVDREILAPVLFSYSETASEGVVPYESVLARIEVKSRLTASELKDALESARAYRRMVLTGLSESNLAHSPQLIFAYDTDLLPQGKSELERLLETLDSSGKEDIPSIQGLCVVGRSFCFYGALRGGPSAWRQFLPSASHPNSHIVEFLGIVMNGVAELRSRRREARLGSYLVDTNVMQTFTPTVPDQQLEKPQL